MTWKFNKILICLFIYKTELFNYKRVYKLISKCESQYGFSHLQKKNCNDSIAQNWKKYGHTYIHIWQSNTLTFSI